MRIRFFIAQFRTDARVRRFALFRRPNTPKGIETERLPPTQCSGARHRGRRSRASTKKAAPGLERRKSFRSRDNFLKEEADLRFEHVSLARAEGQRSRHSALGSGRREGSSDPGGIRVALAARDSGQRERVPRSTAREPSSRGRASAPVTSRPIVRTRRTKPQPSDPEFQ